LVRALIAVVVALCHAQDVAATAVASGRNWSISIDGLECHGNIFVLGLHIRYLGPSGPVEAPVTQLLDARGKQHLPRSLAWKPGAKPLAEWLSKGGLRNLKTEPLGEVELKFDVEGATPALNLEFGDIPAFSLTSQATGKGACERVLKPDQIRAPRAARRARVDPSKLDFPVHRARYPCSPSRTIADGYPPYLPRQLLLFGHGYLPNARQIELPMGRSPAQPYAYAGPDNLAAVEQAARQALMADFPQYGRRSKYFAFNWGVQKSQSGNEMYSIGLYDLRPCPK
jgi:hypothetical protein